MIGAIVGDIVGSIYEFDSLKTKDFELFDDECYCTDDSIMTLSVCNALLECDGDYSNLSNVTIKSMQKIGRKYPFCGYGSSFFQWLYSNNPKPYNSFGNGSAMRVSGVAWVANSINEVKDLTKKVTEISHNHPEGLKGAEAIALCVYLARIGKSKDEIKQYVKDNYYSLDFTIDQIRKDYVFDVTCQGSVPQAIECFLESTSFEDAIRLAISLGGDGDTIGAMAGSIAEAYYGVPNDIRTKALSYLDDELYNILTTFETKYKAFK